MRFILLALTISCTCAIPFASLRPLLFHEVNANNSLLGVAGKCTYYNYGGTGACGSPIAKGVAICAMGQADDWKSHCGKTIEFSNGKGSGTCEVRDECPECQKGHLDMTLAAFLHVCTVEEGVCAITWRIQGSDEKRVANVSARIPSNYASLPFHDGITAEAASVLAAASNTTMPEVWRWNFADASVRTPAENGLVYNNMELLREWAYSWCGAGNVDAWSTGKSSAGDNAGALACDNGAWKGFTQFSCLDSLTTPVDVVYGTALKKSASPSDVHTFEDDNCKSSSVLHRSFKQSVSTSNTYSWSNTVALEMSESFEVTAGIPDICQVKDSFSIKLDVSSTISNSETKVDSEDIETSYDVPAHSRTSFQVVFSKTKYDLPYKSVLQLGGSAAVKCKKPIAAPGASDTHSFWFPSANYFLPSGSAGQISCTSGSPIQCAFPGVFSGISGVDYSTHSASSKC